MSRVTDAIKKYRLGLFKDFLDQLNVNSDLASIKSALKDCPLESISFKSFVLPIFIRAIIFVFAIRYRLKLSYPVYIISPINESFWSKIKEWTSILFYKLNSWVYNLIQNLNQWVYEYIKLDIFVLSIVLSIICFSLVFMSYMFYVNRHSRLEYYVSQKLFMDTLSQANKGIDPDVIQRMEKTLETTSKLATDFTGFMDVLNKSLDEKKQVYSTFPTEMDERIKQINEILVEFNEYANNLAKILSTTILKSLETEHEHMEIIIKNLSTEFLNKGVSQEFVAISTIMSQMANKLDATVFTMQGISEEFNSSMKTYIWFNETAIQAAEQLKSASNQFSVSVQPFNEMIDRTSDVMRQTIGYLNYMSHACIQTVSDALEKNIEVALESREEWIKKFVNDFTTIVIDSFNKSYEKFENQIYMKAMNEKIDDIISENLK